MRGDRTRNMEIVLDCLLKSNFAFFKNKRIYKVIGGEHMTKFQIANGLRTLHEEGYIERYNGSETWTWTKKGKKLLEEK